MLNFEDKSRTVFLCEQINEKSAKQLISDILAIDCEDNKNRLKASERKPIRLLVNSVGGSIDHALAIISIIDSLETPIYAYNLRDCYSAAMFVFVSCAKRFGTKYSSFLLHESYISLGGGYTPIKDATIKTSRANDDITIIDNIILSKTTINSDKLKEANSSLSGWRFDSIKAQSFGVIDEIL